ncbi:MAG: hypothetical protein N2444_06800 [Methylocystis sp.]|nr:hypothetical protein [Methylocystis sp.]
MSGPIDACDVEATLALRREVYSGDATITRDEFCQLLEAGRIAGDAASREFDELISEAAVDLFALQVEPQKYVSQDDADWLVSLLRAAPGLAWRTERAILVGLARVAVSLPASLSRFIASRFESVMINGHEAAQGADHAAGVVTPEDLEALRIVLFSATEGNALHVSRDEAEMLFRVAQLTRASDETPGFADFFAKAVGNYLMGVAFDRCMTREKAAEARDWLNAPAPGFGEFIGAMAGGVSLNGVREATASVEDRAETFYRDDNAEDAAAMARAAPIDAGETQWLMLHLTRAGELTGAEKALLRFLKAAAPERAPGLDALIAEKAA